MSKYSISCQNVDVSDCDFEVRSASSEEELFEILGVHARIGHSMREIPPEKVEAVKKAVKVHQTRMGTCKF